VRRVGKTKANARFGHLVKRQAWKWTLHILAALRPSGHICIEKDELEELTQRRAAG